MKIAAIVLAIMIIFIARLFKKRIPNFEKDIIPDWCPLRPLPRKEEMPKRGDDDFNDFCRGYSMGFNDCIDEITKENEPAYLSGETE